MKDIRYYTVKENTISIHDEPTLNDSHFESIIDINDVESLRYYRNNFRFVRSLDIAGQ